MYLAITISLILKHILFLFFYPIPHNINESLIEYPDFTYYFSYANYFKLFFNDSI